jgi:tripartite-type tricarboxylate transporter receptor subunit TctC
MRTAKWFGASLVALLTAGTAAAQGTEFPNKPIRMLAPFAAGSGADSSARALAEQMQRILGQPVLVENRPGASGAVAAMAVKQAPADGYTIMVGSNSPMSVNPIVIKNLGYDPLKEFKAVHGIGRSQNIWYVANESPVRTISDLVAQARTRAINVGSYSAGYQLAMEWVALSSKTKLTYVPYKGQAQVFTDVIGRQLDAGLGDLGGALSLIQSGKMRAIAVSGEARHPALPNVPTLREVWPEYINYAWTAFWVRTETPADVHAKLVSATNRAMKTPELTKYFETQGSEPMYTFGPVEMGRYQSEEYQRFKGIADAVGIKPE